MKIFFPTVGSQLRLDADWSFPLHDEPRNHALFCALGLVLPRAEPGPLRHARYFSDYVLAPGSRAPGAGRSGWATVRLPAGTVLQVDRIFLRKSLADFDSITFLVATSPDRRLLPWRKQNPGAAMVSGTVRFWAKLEHVNGIEGEWLERPAAFEVHLPNKALHA